jgi:hypothetical protein
MQPHFRHFFSSMPRSISYNAGAAAVGIEDSANEFMLLVFSGRAFDQVDQTRECIGRSLLA